MSSSNDEDLDWLYGRERQRAQPERTRVMPSPSAIVVLLGALALGHAWFGVLLVLAYGLGLAATLTGIGVFITGSGRWLAARVPGLRDHAHRIPARLVPAGSAAIVVLLGVALAVRSLATALGGS